MLMLFLVLVAIQVAFGREIPKNSLQIVGGKEVDISERPYTVSVLAYNEISCGGVLISNDIVLSNAGCIGQPSVYNRTYLSVRVGSNHYNSDGQVLKVRKVLIHPKYRDLNNDIGLIWLDGTINTTIASPAALPKANQTWSDGTMASISGWGSTMEIPQGWEIPAKTLHSVDMPITSVNCTEVTTGYIDGTLMCLGFNNNHTIASCIYDGGGPAVINNTVAALIWMNNCLFLRDPGVFINVAYYVDWIRESTGL